MLKVNLLSILDLSSFSFMLHNFALIFFTLVILLLIALLHRQIKSSKLIKSYFDESSDGILISDINGQIIRVNKIICKLTGYNKNELLKMNLTELIDEKSLDKLPLQIGRLRNEEAYIINRLLKKKDGTKYYAEVSAILMSEGNVFSIVRDINIQKQTQIALEESEKKYRQIVENLSETVYSLDKDGNFTFITPAVGTITGFKASEIVGRNFIDFICEEDRSLVKKEFEQNKEGYYHPIEYRVALPNSEIKWVRSSSKPVIENNQFLGVHGIIKDITEKKLSEIALKESEEKYRELIEQSADGILIVNDNYDIILVNNYICDLLGYSKEEILKLNVKDTYVDGDVENLYKRKTLLDNKTVLHFERLAKRKDGTTFPVEISLKHINKDYIQGIMRDISERKKAELQLRNNEERYRSLFHKNLSVMLLIDPATGNIIDANQSAAKFYGYTTEELKRMNIERISILNLDDVLNILHNAVIGKNNHQQLKHVMSDGTVKDVETFMSPIILKDRKVLYGIVNDITEKLVAEENLKKLSTAVEQSPVSILITDTDGKIFYVNPKFCKLTGYSVEEAIGKNPRILKSGKNSQKTYEELWAAVTSGKTWHGELLNKKKNGDLYWENVTISPIKNSVGIITHYVAVKEDITKQKETIKELTEAKEKAEEASRLKSNFLANMSHELRTPLVGILGYSELLRNELKSAELKEWTDTINESGQRLLDTLNQILDLTKIETDRFEVEIIKVDIVETVSEVIKLFEKTAFKKDLFLKAVSGESHIYFNTDPNLIRLILSNLISNAIKFTHDGGIDVSIFLNQKNEKHELSISVKDTGIGIPNEKHKLIFEEFRQVSEGLNRGFEGSGLGLTLVKKYLEMLKGRIILNSSPGNGSEFIIKLPDINTSSSTNQFSTHPKHSIIHTA